VLSTTRRNGEAVPDYVTRTWRWYAGRARISRWAHHTLELVNLLLAAAIPATLALGAPAAVPALFGAGVVVCGGLRQIFDWHPNWIRFTQVKSEIERQVALFGAALPPYVRSEHAARTLVAAINETIQADLAGWAIRSRTRPPGTEVEQASG
jgi:hypothetical protein